MKTNRTSIFGMSLFCALIVQASNPVPFTSHNFESTPTGIVATLEFDSETGLLYSIFRSDNLASNAWNVVTNNLPGTGSSMVYVDTAPLTLPAHFYTASSISAGPVDLIANGGFEDPALASGGTNISASSDWVLVGNNITIQNAGWAAETGNQGAWLKGWSPNQDNSFYQDSPATPGMIYTLDAGFKFNPNFEPNGSTLDMDLIWLDGAGSEISRTTLHINDHLDSSDNWKHLSISSTAPAGTTTARALFRFTTDDTIETSSNSSALVDNVSLFSQPPGAGWGGFSSATRAAAAQYAGLYAVAHTNILITDINEQTVGTTSVADINGMAFTASGRQLFIASDSKVQAFNIGTGVLSDFVTGLSLGTEKTGIAHFKGELFVGTDGGDILRYDAQLDDLTGSYNSTVSVGEPVRSIAADIQDEMLYVASSNHLYRLNPTNTVLTQIATVSNLVSISFGRTYGAAGQGGLILLQDTGTERNLLLISTADLQTGASVTPTAYISTPDELKDLAATACGRILTAEPVPEMMADAGDTRMDFMEWVADEFEQNVLLAKTLCWQDSGDLVGIVRNAATRWNRNRTFVATPDAAYWVVNQLLMSHDITGDLEAQSMVREIVKRYAQIEVNSDGQWYHYYNPQTGAPSWGGPDYETSAYSTMKAVHMAIRAKNYFSYDTEIVAAANTIIGNLRNQRDYVRDFGKYGSPADDLGPVIAGHRPGPYQELHLFGELMAATEPMCENSYLDYWRYRDNHTYNYELPNEPIVRTKMAGFWRMYDQATVAYCRESEPWREEFKNFGALFSGWTDDHAPDHLTAFSAGSVPDLSAADPSSKSTYSSDKYTSHPGTVNSIGTVIGFGLHGDTVPVVGAYFAYRDGQRQLMEGSSNYTAPNLLTRISYDYPSWIMQNISPTDHQYAGYALGEILSPGSIDRTISNPTYLEPQWSVQTNGGYLVEFSQLVKRQVWGTADGSNWDFLGFQRTPYSIPASSGYTNFAVIGAEGELLDPASSTSTEEDYDVSADFDDTLYIVRGVTTSMTAQVRAQWFDGGSFLSEQSGSPTGLEAKKPATATILRIAVVEGTTPVAADQLSVVLDGAVETFTNSGFEDGNFSGWTRGNGTGMNKAVIDDSRLEGIKACELTASESASNGAEAWIQREYDISGDAIGTHYILKFEVLTENLQGSSIRTQLTVPDCAYNDTTSNWVDRVDYFDTFEHANTQTMLSAGSRKRNAQHQSLKFRIRLRRDDASKVTADERVLIDNLRLLKMKP